MDIKSLVSLMTEEDFTIEVNHSVVTINENEIGFCYTDDEDSDGTPTFDLVLDGKVVEKFNLDDVSYSENETPHQLIHTCLTSWVDYMDE
jgi:hypothetical protein